MKRQLIAALLALNVAAVAVPSATFTVSAANVDETAVEAQATEVADEDAVDTQAVNDDADNVEESADAPEADKEVKVQSDENEIMALDHETTETEMSASEYKAALLEEVENYRKPVNTANVDECKYAFKTFVTKDVNGNFKYDKEGHEKYLKEECYYFRANSAAAKEREQINKDADSALNNCGTDKAAMRRAADQAKLKVDGLANEAVKDKVRKAVAETVCDKVIYAKQDQVTITSGGGTATYDTNGKYVSHTGVPSTGVYNNIVVDQSVVGGVQTPVPKYFDDTFKSTDPTDPVAPIIEWVRPADNEAVTKTEQRSFKFKDDAGVEVTKQDVMGIVDYYVKEGTGKLDTSAKTEEQAKEYLGYINRAIEDAKLETKEVLREKYIAKADSYMPFDWKLEDYTVKEQEAILGYKKTAINTIKNVAANEEDVRKAFEKTYKDIFTNVSAPEVPQEPAKVTALRTNTLKALDTYLSNEENNYTPTQLQTIKGYKTEYRNKIAAAKRKAEIKSLYDEAIKNINAVIKKDQSEANVKDAMNKIMAIGKLDSSNYKEKYASIKAANNAYNGLEEGSVGKTKIEKENALKKDPNVNVDTDGNKDHYTYKEVLDNAKNRYDDLTILELTEAYKKLSVDLVTVDTNNYQDYQARFESAVAAEKTLFDKDRKTGDYDWGAYTTAKNQAEKAYDAAKKVMIDAAGKDFSELVSGSLKHIIDKDIDVKEENVQDIIKAINAYEILAKFAKTDSDLLAANVRADQAYRKDGEKYNTLVSLYTDYQNKKEAEEARLDLSQGKLTVNTPTVEYNGLPQRPEGNEVTVTDKDGKEVAASNYILTYDENVNKGIAKVTAVAKAGGYTKSVTGEFTIAAKNISKETVKAADMYYYNGTARNAALTVTVAGKNLAKDTDYTVTYKNNKKIGQATAVVTGKGNYTGEISAKYIIKPAKAPLKSLKAGKKKLTVKTTKQSDAKYQIAYKVKGASSFKTVKTSSVSKTIKSLKSGKTYAVKVRAYKSINGKTYYGRYSATKTVKVK